jgi:hypothetical protein
MATISNDFKQAWRLFQIPDYSTLHYHPITISEMDARTPTPFNEDTHEKQS